MDYLEITTSYPQSSKQLKGGNGMDKLYKTTLLITMAVVTWKVMKIEVNTRKTTINFTNNKNVKTTRRFGSSQQKL